jgi:hypothetical protein
MALLLGAAEDDDEGAAEDDGAAAEGCSELLQAPRATVRAAVALRAASRWIFRTWGSSSNWSGLVPGPMQQGVRHRSEHGSLTTGNDSVTLVDAPGTILWPAGHARHPNRQGAERVKPR